MVAHASQTMRLTGALAAAASGFMLAPCAALAHSTRGTVLGFQSGFLHPLSGADHMIAMVAVGIWGAQLGAPAIWLLPITFPIIMALGGVFGILGFDLPGTEIMIGASGLVLGLAVATRARVPLWGAAIVVGIFGLAHGFAHGRELPRAADALAFGVGFVVATGLLHLTGILIGTLIRWPAGARAVQGLGVCIAALGGFFLYSAVAHFS